MASITKRPDGRYRARYRETMASSTPSTSGGKADAQELARRADRKLVTGTHVAPRQARTTVEEWCDIWIDGYRGRRESTVRQAEVHLLRIRAEFGSHAVGGVRPVPGSGVVRPVGGRGVGAELRLRAPRAACAGLPQTPCTTAWWPSHPALAVRHPRRASSGLTWRLPSRYGRCTTRCPSTSAAVLLGAFAGLRLAEACGLRVADVDFMRGVVRRPCSTPQPLKTERT